MGGQDSKWEEGAADSGIRGLMSNDGGDGDGRQRAAGTPITQYTPAMEGDGNAHSSSSPPPWTGCHQSGLSEGQAQSSMGRPERLPLTGPSTTRVPDGRQRERTVMLAAINTKTLVSALDLALCAILPSPHNDQ